MADQMTFEEGPGIDFLREVAGVGGTIEATIVTTDARTSDYWPSLEYGSRRGNRPWPSVGPRTRYGSDGRIYSSQAPGGFIRKNQDVVFGIMRDEYDNLTSVTRSSLAGMLNRSAERVCGLLQKIVPVDTGQFKDSISYKRAG